MKLQFDDIRDRTLPRLLAHQAERRPDEPFLRFCDGDWVSFAAMEDISARLAGGLQDLGLRPGDRLAMVLPNCAEFVPLWFAAARLGAVEVPVDCHLKGRILRYVLSDCAASVLVVHTDLLAAVVEALEDAKCFEHVVVVGGLGETAAVTGIAGDRTVSFEELSLSPAVRPELDIVQPKDPIAILYTSGTTGPAKGVIMPHHQFYMFAETMAASMDLTSADTYFMPLPLFHGDAQLFGVYFPLVFGARGVIYDRFSASRFWDQVRGCGATATNLLGAMAHILWRQPPTQTDRDNGIRVCQALPMVPFKEEFERRFGLSLVTGYGQTETNFVAFDTVGNQRLGSCGRITDGFEVSIVDEDDNVLAAGEVGEIVIRSSIPWSMALGYFGKDAKTVEAWRNLRFHTGDAGYLDDDGWLYFSNRIKDMIRRRGKNISAHEVEMTINEHPAVLECAAVAVPSELSEDDVKAVVRVGPDHELAPEDLLIFCERHLPRYMVPRYVEIRHEPLPRTPTEKIAKERLRAEGVGLHTWDSERDRDVFHTDIEARAT